ncbi:putative RhoA GTPase effector DIA/Diaphanous [Mycena sanguinolenta]|uniref:Putative RhoA GTPase effector DIA/Diaphanous n=1 Tax=Mycena sanguinolenta TaxID=230812 RepID=A0A8H6YJM3_9AGAR|nr:putative RhoA GTPase effector DIA/Diaphanous [Mycena sanguinolenta]
MDSIFGRNKKLTKPRQPSLTDLADRSVPYDRLPSPRSPNRPSNYISAPITNPTLTQNGTELNKFTIQRTKVEREKAYDTFATTSSSSSLSTADSATLYNESLPSPSKMGSRRSEASSTSSSGMRSPHMSDFGQFAPPTPNSAMNFPGSTSSATMRPISGMTTRSSNSDGNHRLSKYAPSFTASEGSHLPHFHLHRHQNGDDFNFPRPETDEEIEALFENVKRTRDLGDLPNLPIEQKWHMVYNDYHIRWKEDKAREEQARKQGDIGPGQPAPIIHESPEWFIRKFLDKTITPKQAGSLQVSLRSKELSWFRHFIAIRGTSVLAQTLNHLSRKGSSRREFDIQLEYEVVKCLKQILNNPSATNEALTHNLIVTQMASSLNTPHLPTRKLLIDLLSFLAYWNDGEAHHLVVAALEALSTANGEGGGCYDYWFKSMELSLSGRGKMGSLVGASDEVKKTGGIDTNLNEYAVANLVLINGVIGFVEDLDLRLHHRAQMEAAGLQRIIALCRGFGVPTIDKQLKILQTVLDEDEAKLRERLDQEILRDLNNPQDVYNAIFAKTQDTKARDYFLSMMQHLLLIREEGLPMVHYYQLIDSLVTDVVLDKKLAGAEQRMGHSVERIIAQFNEADRYQFVEEEANNARAEATRLRLEKEALEDEIAEGQDGLVGRLKSQLAHMDEKLSISRETVSRLQGQLEVQKAGYEEQIAQLEAQIMELFKMLKEMGKGVDSILDASNTQMDRKTLVATLEKHFQRAKTIGILEGSERWPKILGEGEDELDVDATPGKKGSLRRSAITNSSKTKTLENGRISQFMDADDADAQEQIEQQLAAGVNVYPPRDGPVSSSRSVRSPRRTDRPDLQAPFKSSNLRAPDGDLSDYSRSSSPGANDDDSSRPAPGSLAEQLIVPHPPMPTLPEESESSPQTAPPPPPPPPASSPAPTAPRHLVPGSRPVHRHRRHRRRRRRLQVGRPPAPASASYVAPWFSSRLSAVISSSRLQHQLASVCACNGTNCRSNLLREQCLTRRSRRKRKEMLNKLQVDGVWTEMEEDFKAKQLVINLMARQKRAELKSVLDAQTKKRKSSSNGSRNCSPKKLLGRFNSLIRNCVPKSFLSELKPILPSPEQVGKLNVYRNADAEELAGLHPSDRLMVKLIQIERLAPRIEGMLYKCEFEETWALLDDSARKLAEASQALLNAKWFKELLSLILLIGNYMNGTGVKGGAFGFRVSSINKLVDTKSVNNTTLLHFLERTVAKHFPDMEDFLEELSKPAEAYRVNLQDLRKGLTDLREGLKRIRQELSDHFADLDQNDKYGKQMWNFVGKANGQLEDLIDHVNLADSTFTEAIKYFGEEDKTMSSSEFYAIFKTFVTSYKKCKADNQTLAEERAALEKRRQAADEVLAKRQQAQDASVPNEDDAVLDTLLAKLREGETVGRRTRRNRGRSENRPPVPQSLNGDGETAAAADVARDMLARLQSDGFVTPASPTVAVSQRRRRPRDMLLDSGDLPSPNSELVMSDSETPNAEEEVDTPPP